MHKAEQAVVYNDSLTISGSMTRTCALTDYGIKVHKAADDMGTELDLRSFQIFWMKVMCFEIEFSKPHPEAQQVHYDIAFISRSGVEALKGSLPIERGRHGNYLMQLPRWQRWRTRHKSPAKTKASLPSRTPPTTGCTG